MKLQRLTYCTKPGHDGCVNTEGSEHAPQGWVHWCQGCECTHAIAVEKPFSNGAKWTFNGNMDLPTFSPSVKTWWQRWGKPHVCHYFLTNGKINYLSDTTHKFSGQTVDLMDLPWDER